MRMYAIPTALALTVVCTAAMGYQAEKPAVKAGGTPAPPQAPVSSRDALIARASALGGTLVNVVMIYLVLPMLERARRGGTVLKLQL